MGVAPLARLAPLAFAGFTAPWQALAQRWQRIEAFNSGGGLKLEGSDADKELLNKMIKKAMWQSPSFEALMYTIGSGPKDSVNVKLVHNQPDVYVDGFQSTFKAGEQEFDLGDLEKIASVPPSGFPDAITKGEVLAHLMAEAWQGAQDGRFYGSVDPDDYIPAHNAGIDAQNAYRDDLGQKGHRRHHPDEGEFNAVGNYEMKYDNGYREVWVKGGTPNSIRDVNRTNPTPSTGGP